MSEGQTALPQASTFLSRMSHRVCVCFICVCICLRPAMLTPGFSRGKASKDQVPCLFYCPAAPPHLFSLFHPLLPRLLTFSLFSPHLVSFSVFPVVSFSVLSFRCLSLTYLILSQSETVSFSLSSTSPSLDFLSLISSSQQFFKEVNHPHLMTQAATAAAAAAAAYCALMRRETS